MRICVTCFSDSTYINNKGVAQWFRKDGGYECSNCYQKRDYVREAKRPLERKYYWRNRGVIVEKRRQYRKEHADEVHASQKKYREENPEILRKQRHDYYQKHKELVKERATRWCAENREKRRIYMREYMRKKRRAAKAALDKLE